MSVSYSTGTYIGYIMVAFLMFIAIISGINIGNDYEQLIEFCDIRYGYAIGQFNFITNSYSCRGVTFDGFAQTIEVERIDGRYYEKRWDS